MKNKLIRRGFTLVELIAVIAVIAILTTIALPRFTDTSKSAKRATLDAHYTALRTAISFYQAENEGALPSGDSETVGKALGKYIQGVGENENAFAHMESILIGSSYTWEDTTSSLLCELSEEASGISGGYQKEISHQ